MDITWQEIATAAILLLAAGYLVRRIVRFIRRKGMPDCHCCPQCPTQADKEPLVAVENRTTRSERNDH